MADSWLVVVAWPVVLSMVLALNRKQYCLDRPPWHHLHRKARPKGVAQVHPEKWEPPIHRHRRQSEVDLVCDLQGRETSLSLEGHPGSKARFCCGTLFRLAATFGRPGVPFGLFSWVQEEDAACLGA